MSSGIEVPQDQVNRLSSALGGHREDASTVWFKQTVDLDSDCAEHWLTDRSMSSLRVEYDRQMKQMEAQLLLYQRQMADVKASLEQVIRENARLHEEQRVSVERELQSLSVGVEGDVATDAVAISNLKEQVKCAVEEKDEALHMWQAAAQELDRVQKLYQNAMRDSQLNVAECQHVQSQLSQAQQHSHELQVTNQNLKLTNQQFLKTVAKQTREVEELRSQLRQTKQDLRAATAKVDEMTRLMQNVQELLQRREEDAAEAREAAVVSERRLQQLQTVLSQLENRLKASAQEEEAVRRDRALWERQVGNLQTRCSSLEEEKFEAFQRVHTSLQLAEEVSLQRDQAQLREKQRVEELERMKDGMKQLVEEAAVRTRREVDVVRKQCNTQIDRLAEELSALQLECADKESQIERAHRERAAVEEELEKLYRDGRFEEPELRKMEALHQRCLNAERQKEEMELTLNTTQSNVKKLEMDFSEELSRCQEEVRRLQVTLTSARDESSSISEDRIRLQQENQQLQKEMDTLRKECVLAQRQAKQQVLHMEQDVCAREQALEAQLREVEESRRSSIAGLNRLLVTQQKTTNRYRDNARQLTDTFQTKLSSLRLELNRQKQRTQEVELQMERDHEKILELSAMTRRKKGVVTPDQEMYP